MERPTRGSTSTTVPAGTPGREPVTPHAITPADEALDGAGAAPHRAASAAPRPRPGGPGRAARSAAWSRPEAERTNPPSGGVMFPTQVRGFAARHRASLLVGTGLAAVVTLQAFVSPSGDVSASTVVPTGRLAASNCFQCHGTNGLSGAFDQLAGESLNDFMEKMHDQQTKSSIMGAQARGYTDAELTKIGLYFSSLPKP